MVISMAHYIKFIVSLSFGLIGVALVMKIFMDRVFIDFDVIAAIKDYFNGVSRRRILLEHRAEDRMLHAENSQSRELSTRLIDRRREQLKELDEVESALNRPRRAVSGYSPVNDSPPEIDGWNVN